jgi:hypothetical protein
MRTITNIGGDVNRDITNGADLDVLEADLPLQIVIDDEGIENDTINLGGLSSFGTTGQVMKVNSNADGLEWADNNDTTYTVANPLTISNQNVISLSNLTGFGTEGQFLKSGPGNTLVYGSDNNTTYTVSNPLTISNQNVISLTGLSGFGQVGQVLRVTTGATGLEYSYETVRSATTPLVITNGVVKLNGLSGYGGGIGQSGKRQLIRTNANASALEYFDQPDFINSATLPLSISIDGVISLATTLTLDRLNMTQGNPIYFKGDDDPNHYIKYSFDGVEVGGYGSGNGTCFQIKSTANDNTVTPPIVPEILAYYFRNYIQFEKNLWMNQKAIYFYLDVSNGLDYNHYIKYSGREGTLGCNGVQVGGYGAGNRACFEVVNTQPLAYNPPTTPIVVFQVMPDKIITNQKLYMTSQPLYFKQNGDTGHYIKYQPTGDCMELGSYSNLDDGDPVFRFVNTFNSELLVSLNKNNNVFNKTTFFTSALNSVSLSVSQSIYCRDITTNTFMTTPQLNVVNTSSTGTITAVNINATNIDTNTLDVALDIKFGAVDKHVYFTPDLFNRIKATSTGVTGGGILITGYDTVRLAEHVNSNRYVELTNATFTISDCDLIMDDYSKAFTCPKATFADTVLYINGRASICNTRIVNANGIVQIDCGRSAFSSEQSFDGMAIRKGTGSHLINFINYDNTANLGQIKATNTNILYEQSSDRRLKTNIVDMRSMIDKIMELKPREYNWIIDNEYDYGFIAQEVHTVFPQMREDVSCYCGEDMENMDMDNPIDKNGNPLYFGVDYGRFTPYLVKAMQEQQAQIDKQKEQIDRQQAQIEMLLEKFNNLSLD